MKLSPAPINVAPGNITLMYVQGALASATEKPMPSVHPFPTAKIAPGLRYLEPDYRNIRNVTARYKGKSPFSTLKHFCVSKQH